MKAHERASLVDVLDRVLERGVVLSADLIICVAGVPLLGVSLRAALAGVETMRGYGLFTQWDEAIRARYRCGATVPDPPAIYGAADQ